jgi:hypothetical protein
VGKMGSFVFPPDLWETICEIDPLAASSRWTMPIALAKAMSLKEVTVRSWIRAGRIPCSASADWSGPTAGESRFRLARADIERIQGQPLQPPGFFGGSAREIARQDPENRAREAAARKEWGAS